MINFKQYEALSEKIKAAANSLWTKVTYLTVAEVVAKEVDIRELISQYDQLSDQSTRARRALSREVDMVPVEEFDQIEEEYNRIESLFYKVDDKLDAIDKTLYLLRSISDAADEDEYLDRFSDSGSINLGESRILLERFSR